MLRQRWHELVYLHWAYDPAEVQRLLPSGVTVDTHDGAAWVGLIPFEMQRVRIGPSPAVPYLGSFIEINVRTYVADQHGRRAVWFFSLDVPRWVIVGVARTIFALPYAAAAATHEVEGVRHRYTCRRYWPDRPAGADIEIEVGRALADDEVTPLDHFLTARWALLTTRRSTVLRGPVDHPRWPLNEITRVEVEADSLFAVAGLTAPSGSPLARYSPGVDVRIGWLRRVGH